MSCATDAMLCIFPSTSCSTNLSLTFRFFREVSCECVFLRLKSKLFFVHFIPRNLLPINYLVYYFEYVLRNFVLSCTGLL